MNWVKAGMLVAVAVAGSSCAPQPKVEPFSQTLMAASKAFRLCSLKAASGIQDRTTAPEIIAETAIASCYSEEMRAKSLFQYEILGPELPTIWAHARASVKEEIVSAIRAGRGGAEQK